MLHFKLFNEPTSAVVSNLWLRGVYVAAKCGRSVPLFAVVAASLLIASEPPSLALAPVSPEQLEGQEMAGETLTTMLAVALSGDDRWRVVERGDLSLLTAEWQLGRAGFEESANAVNHGRLLGADWVLVCRPEMADVDNPTATIDVIDAVRAEPIASRKIKLAHRPHARWFRSPPEVDVKTLVDASHEALSEALTTRERRQTNKVAASLFLSGDNGHLERALAALLSENADDPLGWRLLNPLHPEAARGEGLLRAAGIVAGDRGPLVRKIADAYLWGAVEPVGTGSDGGRLTFWVWRGFGDPEEKQAEGSWSELAESIRSELAATAPGVDEQGDALEHQIRLSKRLMEEALAVAPASTADFNRARKLLEMAAFFAPQDRVVQETRLAYVFAPRRIQTGLTDTERMRLWLEYARLADAFWVGPNNTLDARLLAASFPGYNRGKSWQRERVLRWAPLLAQAPVDELIPHKKLLSEWATYSRADRLYGQRILEMIWPMLAHLLPDKLYTHASDGQSWKVGWVDQLMRDPTIDQARFKEMVAGSATGLPPLVRDVTQARYRIVDTPAPDIGGGVIEKRWPDRSTREVPPPNTLRIVKRDGFFKLLAHYQFVASSFMTSDATHEKRLAEHAARRELHIAKVEATNPEAARRMREHNEGFQKQVNENRRASVDRALEDLRQYAAAQSKDGTVPAPGINDRQNDGATPLAIAVANGWPAVAEILIWAGADPLQGWIRSHGVREFAASDPVMSRVLAGKSAATATAIKDDVDGAMVVALLSKGDRAALSNVPIDDVILSYTDTRGWTVLHHAIERHADDFALRMIAAGAPLEATSMGGQTPLTFAAFKARDAVVGALLEKKANPNGRSDESAATPLLAACVGGDVGIVRALLDAGADANARVNGAPVIVTAARDSKNAAVIKELIVAGARVDVADWNNWGPLEMATVHDRDETLGHLLEANAKWKGGPAGSESSPLIVAARNNAVRCVQLLLERGERDDRARQFTSDPVIRAMLEDKMQSTATGVKTLDDDVLWPAIFADKHKWRERMDSHLGKGGNINFRSTGWTPLWLAIQTRNLECVRYALAKGADPKVHPRAPNLQNRTTLNGVNFMQSLLEPHRGPELPPIGEREVFQAELVKLLVPLEPSPEYGWALGRALADRQWLEAAAYVRAGANTEEAKTYLSENKKLTEAERARAAEILSGR